MAVLVLPTVARPKQATIDAEADAAMARETQAEVQGHEGRHATHEARHAVEVVVVDDEAKGTTEDEEASTMAGPQEAKRRTSTILDLLVRRPVAT